MTCVVCDRLPARDGGLCHNCNAKLEAGKLKAKGEKAVKFAHYRGNVIGFFPNGGKKLVARLIRRNPEKLPKNNTLDLNTYIEGMTREQVKRIKSAILTLANA